MKARFVVLLVEEIPQDVQNPLNNGINYQPQQVSRISSINSINLMDSESTFVLKQAKGQTLLRLIFVNTSSRSKDVISKPFLSSLKNLSKTKCRNLLLSGLFGKNFRMAICWVLLCGKPTDIVKLKNRFPS